MWLKIALKGANHHLPLAQLRVTHQGKAWTLRPWVFLPNLERSPTPRLLQTPLNDLMQREEEEAMDALRPEGPQM